MSDPEKKKKKKSDRSNRSSQQKSAKKEVKTGLSPPKSKSMSVKSTEFEAVNEEIDQTQWEFSHDRDVAKGVVNEKGSDPNQFVAERVGEATPFLAEQKQKMLVRGEHLKQKPYFTLFFLFVEILLSLTILIAWSFHTDQNEFVPLLLCFCNVIILLLIVLTVFVIQFGRFNVVEESLDEDIRFRVPYEWKSWLFMSHALRFFLTCSCITIAALDNDFDGGTIVMVSGMPVLLIIAAGHALFALRPQG